MATIVDFAQAIEALILAGAPDYRTDLPYRKAATHVPIEKLPVTDSWWTTTRTFRVVPTPRISEGRMNGFDVDREQDVEIKLRYWNDEGPDHGDELVQFLAAADAARIVNLLLRPNAATALQPAGAQDENLFFVGAEGPSPCDVAGIQILTLTIRVRYLSLV